MKVEVFSAGDHFHSDPEGANLLIEMLLCRAGYTKDLTWKCRIDKMLHCDSLSPPIRVTGYKEFGVYMRVKPGANATRDHQMTLLIPDRSGYTAENLFNQLKGCEKGISRRWREELREKKKETMTEVAIPVQEPKHSIPVAVRPTPAPVEVVPAPAIPEIVRPDFTNLGGVVNSPEKLRYVLSKIAKVIEKAKSKEDFLALVQEYCLWQNFMPRIVGKVISEIERHDLIRQILGGRTGRKIVGYELTEHGQHVLHHGSTPPKPRKADEPTMLPKAPKVEVDLSEVLRTFSDRAQELADIGRRLQAIEDERKELQQKMDVLYAERVRLTEIIAGGDYADAIARLMTIKVVPMQTKTSGHASAAPA